MTDLRALLTRAGEVLAEIDCMPYSMVNDSESLRHTIRTMQTIARALHAEITAAEAVPASSSDYHQQRGIAWDIIDEALCAYDEFMLDDNYDWAATLRSIMAKMRERSTGASASSRGQPAPDDGWRDIASAPKDGTPFLAWCPIIIGLGDSDATPDAEMRVIWWEARGQFTSDRDLGNESFTHWRPLPPPPAEREYDPRVAPCDDAEFGMKP